MTKSTENDNIIYKKTLSKASFDCQFKQNSIFTSWIFHLFHFIIVNQKKIGLFIAKCRKNKKLTQVQLAEILGVSDRTISNWENGVYLPDIGLYRLICNVLEISINELFAGEFICNEEYRRIADENLLKMFEYRIYEMSSKDISFNEFEKSLKRISEINLLLKRRKDRKSAIQYLSAQTGLGEQECSIAYDFYIKLFV